MALAPMQRRSRSAEIQRALDALGLLYLLRALHVEF